MALAAALQRRGVPSTVYERTRRYRPAGAAITLWPNGLAALDALGVPGLRRGVEAQGWTITESRTLRPDGAVLATVPVAEAVAPLGFRALAIHRACLQEALLGAQEAGPPLMGMRAAEVFEDTDGPGVRLEDGSEHRGDVVIGADGLRSVVRGYVAGEDEPHRFGFALWRGTCALEDASLAAGRAFETWSRLGRFGMVQIARGVVYWYAAMRRAPVGSWEDVRPRLAARFGSWSGPIARALRATRAEHAVRTEIMDRNVPRAWSRGRVALLGDAAHPMTPDLGQGACCAIEDAATLADMLGACGRGASPADLAEALSRYSRARSARCRALSRRSRRLTSICQSASPMVRVGRDVVARLTPRRALARSLRAGVCPVVGG